MLNANRKASDQAIVSDIRDWGSRRLTDIMQLLFYVRNYLKYYLLDISRKNAKVNFKGESYLKWKL